MVDFYLPKERSLEYFQLIEKNYSPMPSNLAAVIVMNWNTTLNVVSLCHSGYLEEEMRHSTESVLINFYIEPSRIRLDLLWHGGRRPQGPRSNFCIRRPIRDCYPPVERDHRR